MTYLVVAHCESERTYTKVHWDVQSFESASRAEAFRQRCQGVADRLWRLSDKEKQELRVMNRDQYPDLDVRFDPHPTTYSVKEVPLERHTQPSVIQDFLDHVKAQGPATSKHFRYQLDAPIVDALVECLKDQVEDKPLTTKLWEIVLGAQKDFSTPEIPPPAKGPGPGRASYLCGRYDLAIEVMKALHTHGGASPVVEHLEETSPQETPEPLKKAPPITHQRPSDFEEMAWKALTASLTYQENSDFHAALYKLFREEEHLFEGPLLTGRGGITGNHVSIHMRHYLPYILDIQVTYRRKSPDPVSVFFTVNSLKALIGIYKNPCTPPNPYS